MSLLMDHCATRIQEDNAFAYSAQFLVSYKKYLYISYHFNSSSGTLWCGMGNKAENDDQLGTYRDLDSCCRTHDKCDRKVNAFAKEYGYRNWRPFTVSDCECDSKFYNCLKAADEHPKAAYIVGKLFFNILRMPCLRFNAYGDTATKGYSKKYK